VERKRKRPGEDKQREKGKTEKKEEWNSPRIYAQFQKTARAFL
jgi:hypothetical protein